MYLFETEKENMSLAVLDWLLENSDPAVRYRTLMELRNTQIIDDVNNAKKALILSENVKSALKLFEVGKAYADAHAFSALAEYGLTRRDLDIDEHVKNISLNMGLPTVVERDFYCGIWLCLAMLIIRKSKMSWRQS